MVKKLMETTLEEEMRAYIGISRYGRSEDRKGYRNGFYPRGLLTSFGYISDKSSGLPNRYSIAKYVS